jgi:hypothetical protein
VHPAQFVSPPIRHATTHLPRQPPCFLHPATISGCPSFTTTIHIKMAPPTTFAALVVALLSAASLAAAGEFDGWSTGRATHVSVPACLAAL